VSGGFKVVVDWDLCQGHGVCEGEAPEVFQLDEEGMMQLLTETPPKSQREAVAKAVRYCPQRAISIQEMK
jgi:ferredoxin